MEAAGNERGGEGGELVIEGWELGFVRVAWAAAAGRAGGVGSGGAAAMGGLGGRAVGGALVAKEDAALSGSEFREGGLGGGDVEVDPLAGGRAEVAGDAAEAASLPSKEEGGQTARAWVPAVAGRGRRDRVEEGAGRPSRWGRAGRGGGPGRGSPGGPRRRAGRRCSGWGAGSWGRGRGRRRGGERGGQ